MREKIGGAHCDNHVFTTHHIALESYEVHLHLKTMLSCGVVSLNEIQQVSKELVATLQHTQGYQWALQVPADVLSQSGCPTIAEAKRKQLLQ